MIQVYQFTSKMAVVANAKTSFKWFFVGCGVISFYFLRFLNEFLNSIITNYLIVILIGYTIISFLLTLWLKSVNTYEVAIRSLGLGITFGLASLITLWAPDSWAIFGWYLCLLSFFHISEYLTTALCNPRTLSLDSFLINHSKEYTIAAICSWLEFWTEWWLLLDLKQIRWMSYAGVAMCVVGEIIRKLAMFTARTNFTHIIQVQKEEGHTLVTRGVYGVWRHPSYVGWFWWSVGTQIILCNPFCIIGYTIVSWNFFKERIAEEEITLLHFFKEDYYNYQKRVPTGLPFIHGYRVEK